MTANTGVQGMLEPCPFCGSRCVTLLAGGLAGGPGNWFVRCDCRASSNDVGRDRAVEFWNTRTAATAPAKGDDQEIVQRIKEACAQVADRHKGSAKKRRGLKAFHLGSEDYAEIVAEERGEDIAAEMIGNAIRALIPSSDRPASAPGISALDDASNACLELASKHGFATGHGDTLADIIREIDGQIRIPTSVGKVQVP